MCVQSKCSLTRSWMGGAKGGSQEDGKVARKCESWSVRFVRRDFFCMARRGLDCRLVSGVARDDSVVLDPISAPRILFDNRLAHRAAGFVQPLLAGRSTSVDREHGIHMSVTPRMRPKSSQGRVRAGSTPASERQKILRPALTLFVTMTNSPFDVDCGPRC